MSIKSGESPVPEILDMKKKRAVKKLTKIEEIEYA